MTLVSALVLAGLARPASSDPDEAHAAEEKGPVKSERGGCW